MGQIITAGKISLKLLSQSITLPHISAYTHIFREFDFDRTPLDPPGTKVVIHNKPNDRALWETHAEDGWHIGTEIEQYRCHKSYTPKTRAERILDTV